MSHSKLPWKTDYHKILDEKGNMIGGLGSLENNELIVRAVNSYPRLIEIARAVSDGNFNQPRIIEKARQAIKEAEQ